MVGFTFLILMGLFVLRSSCNCIMDGPCIEGPMGDVFCAKTFKPKPLEKPLYFINEVCPFFTPIENLCCNDRQVERLGDMLKMAVSLLKQCPSCHQNFKQIFCHFTCAPNQDDFLNITKIERNSKGQDLVREITYFIKEKSAVTLFESCRNVQGLAPGQTIMNVTAMCGSWGQEKCTAKIWLDFLGSDKNHNGYNAFQMNFRYMGDSETIKDGSKTYRGLDPNMTTCDSPAGPKSIPCECSDCVQACSTRVTTSPDHSTKVTTSPVTSSTHHSSKVTTSRHHNSAGRLGESSFVAGFALLFLFGGRCFNYPVTTTILIYKICHIR